MEQQQRPPFSPHNVYRTPSYYGHHHSISNPILRRTEWNGGATMLLSPPPPPPRPLKKRDESSLAVDDDENERPSLFKSLSSSDTAVSPSLSKELFIPLLEDTDTAEDCGIDLSFDCCKYRGNGFIGSASTYSANVLLGVRLPKRPRHHYRHDHASHMTNGARDVTTGTGKALFSSRIP